MPAYNFKDQFVPLIQSGRKTTTIRQRRAQRPTKVGDRLFLFNRMRQSKCRLIKDTECIALRPIRIYCTNCPEVVLGDVDLKAVEINTLAIRDGFKNSDEFFAFFRQNYGIFFQGELIEWKP